MAKFHRWPTATRACGFTSQKSLMLWRCGAFTMAWWAPYHATIGFCRYTMVYMYAVLLHIQGVNYPWTAVLLQLADHFWSARPTRIVKLDCSSTFHRWGFQFFSLWCNLKIFKHGLRKNRILQLDLISFALEGGIRICGRCIQLVRQGDRNR